MALALAQYEDLFQLVGYYLYGVRMACRIGYRTTSTLNYGNLYWNYAIRQGGSYICLPSESNGPNLLDEPLKGFIVNPTDLPWQ